MIMIQGVVNKPYNLKQPYLRKLKKENICRMFQNRKFKTFSSKISHNSNGSDYKVDSENVRSLTAIQLSYRV